MHLVLKRAGYGHRLQHHTFVPVRLKARIQQPSGLLRPDTQVFPIPQVSRMLPAHRIDHTDLLKGRSGISRWFGCCRVAGEVGIQLIKAGLVVRQPDEMAVRIPEFNPGNRQDPILPAGLDEGKDPAGVVDIRQGQRLQTQLRSLLCQAFW